MSFQTEVFFLEKNDEPQRAQRKSMYDQKRQITGMIFIKQKNRRFFKLAAKMIICFFFFARTAGTAFAAGVLPGFYGSTSNAVTAPQINALPSLKNIVQGVSSLEYPDGSQLIVHQDEANAIIDWDSFDIGVDAWVHFDQEGNSSWKALNRIYDQDPSRIYGRLTADGHVYLINQNGMFFSPGSKVNVGSLVASSLNISDEDFIAGTKSFVRENFIDPESELNGEGVVSNHGTISVDDSGSVFLLGSIVENDGEISAYLGWVALAAGSSVDIYQEESNDIINSVVSVEDGGDAYNYTDGVISADLGQVGMYGKTVTQQGIISSVTAVRKSGRIELFASEKVVLSEDSLTVTPISDSDEEVSSTFPFSGGEIIIDGLGDDQKLRRIEHYGTISSPSGTVSLNAQERIYLEEGSVIDVSGLWIEKPVSEKMVEIQLNSVELRDDYGQKDGVLAGETLKVSILEGSTIGDISSYLTSDENTAYELALNGGQINLEGGSGDIIIKSGSLLDASGGGINYTSGNVDESLLLSVNNIVYSISEAPQWEAYSKILGEYSKIYERYGLTEEYSGIYYGGAAPLYHYAEGFTQGSDGGYISLLAESIVLDGMIDASVTQGEYQIYYADDDIYKAMGVAVPEAGTLVIGDDSASNYVYYQYADPVVNDIVISSDVTSLSSDFGPDDPYPESYDGKTYISSAVINDAGLGTLEIYSRKNIIIEEDAEISLASGGDFYAAARNIIHYGEISVPGGNIALRLLSNITTDSVTLTGNENIAYVPVEDLEMGFERLYLAEGSILNAAGEQIDNSLIADIDNYDPETGLLSGGTVTLSDETGFSGGIIVADGAFIDVSGGYLTDSDDDISGGDAGQLVVQSPAILLDGVIAGYSLYGQNGGQISLHAGSVSIVSQQESGYDLSVGVSDDIPDYLENTLILDDDIFYEAGFTKITLTAVDKVEISSDAVLSTSSLKFDNPYGGSISDEYGTEYSSDSLTDNNLIIADDIYLGESSISLNAGVELEGEELQETLEKSGLILINDNSELVAAPGGTITAEGNVISVNGSLYAPGGEIELSAGRITLESGSVLSVAGYNIINAEDTISDLHYTNYSNIDGGSIELNASTYDITINEGAVLDVSGSETVISYTWDEDGNYEAVKTASEPGSISFSFYRDLVIDGELKADAYLDNLKGGTLTVSRESENDPLLISCTDLAYYLDAGFDSISLISMKEVFFTDNTDISVRRDLTIDAPVISAADGVSISFAAPLITLQNSYDYYEGKYDLLEGESSISLNADFIDINGYVSFSAFDSVELIAAQDISLDDYYYTMSSGHYIRTGGLEQTGELVLQADRIYPETLSSIKIKSGGDLTILGNGNTETSDSIYSAGGTLELTAPNIYQYGNVYAPLGDIIITATDDDGVVYLGENSVTSTYTDTLVSYGLLDDEGIFWGLPTDSGALDEESPVESAPTGSVVIEADSVVTAGGSEINVSGGGEIFSYVFLPGTDGSVNPLSNSSQYVILSDNSVYSSGETIVIGENSILPAGEYYILSEEYAFLPGAVILTDMGTGQNPLEYTVTEEGYSIVSGKFAVAETDIEETVNRYFSVRSAEDLLSEGYFEIMNLTAGDGGNISLKGSTTILEGVIKGDPIDENYTGGIIELTGKDVLVMNLGDNSVSILPDNFDPLTVLDDQIDADLLDKLILSDSSISGQGMDKIIIGDEDSTLTITFEEGAELSIENIELNASESITVNRNTVIEAISDSGDGIISFNSPEGELSIAEDTLIHASDAVELNSESFDIKGELQVDNSLLSITSEKILFVSDDDTDRSESAAYITQSLWEFLSGTDTIKLGEGSEIIFDESFDLNVSSGIIFDVSLIKTADSEISVSSESITFLNSGDSFEGLFSEGTGSLTVNADNISFSEGVISYDGFSQIEINSANDLILQGEGAIITGNADLYIDSAGISSSPYETDDTFNSLDYSINAGSGDVVFTSNGKTHSDVSVEGGSFDVLAGNIYLQNILDMPGTYISLTATGTEDEQGIMISAGALINAEGGDNSPGGKVTLTAEKGNVTVSSGSVIDVSAGTQGDAGEIEISSPENAAVIAGTLKGASKEDGTGGSVSVDSLRIDDLSSLINIFDQGGFDNEIVLRAREGDLVLEEDSIITASGIVFAADGNDGNGNIEIYGRIEADGELEDNYVELYAKEDLNIYSKSVISASSSDSSIILSGENRVLFENNAEILMGNNDEGSAGIVFRSLLSGDNLDVTLKGRIIGADNVSVESVTVYDDDDHDGYIDSEIDQWESDMESYMADASTIKNDLFKDLTVDDSTSVYLVPVIEVRSENDLTVSEEWDLSSSWKYDTDGDGVKETAGSLILRTSGNLTVEADIIDSATDKYDLYKDSDTDSWDIGLVSGADLSAANPFSVTESGENGDLIIESEVLIYTERGDINFASGNDVLINEANVNTIISPNRLGFNIATYSGSVTGVVSGTLTLLGGAIQTSGGNIDLKTGGDIVLKRSNGFLGTIRTFGTPVSGDISSYYTYEQEGTIHIETDGGVFLTPSASDPWDAIHLIYDLDTMEVIKEWGASYSGNFGKGVSQGIVAMAGGDIYIKSGSDVTASVGNFGEGDISIYTAGDVNGRFALKNGTGTVFAAGNYGTLEGLEDQHIELLDSQFSVTVNGSIELGTIVNPTLANSDYASDSSWNLTYTEDTAVSLNALYGSVSLSGETRYYDTINQTLKQKILPASVSISSGKDILFSDIFLMAPSSYGQLTLKAGRDISGYYFENDQSKSASIYMSDMDPLDVYGDKTDEMDGAGDVNDLLKKIKNGHSKNVLHRNDKTAVAIQAGRDLDNIALYLPKAAEISAGGNIVDIYYQGQNTGSSDVSLIEAGQDIYFSSSITTGVLTGIVHGGPGVLMVKAAGNIDLGTTDGIQLVGSQYNPYLSNGANDLVILSGLNSNPSLVSLESFFSYIQERGSAYSELLAMGDVEGAEDIVAEIKDEIIAPLTDTAADGAGNIDMVESQINVTGNSGSIYILSMGEINVGKSTFSESGSVQSDAGIYTTSGGSVNIFSTGDINVNESRIMTFAGGDITIWSDEGDINAGRGSKASVNATDSEAVYDEETGTWSVVWEAPAVGSGVRTLTFDPDGLEGPLEEPLPGDVYLFAPEGEIDAGEAGISGSNVVLGATEIVNSQNISFSQGSVGVPVSTTSVNIGAMTGGSDLTSTNEMTENATASIADAQNEAMQEAMKALEEAIAKWLSVEVVGFYVD